MFEFIYKKFGTNVEYISRIISYYFIMILSLTISSYLFDNFYMMIIGTIVMNVLRMYTYGFHCKKLSNCIIFTNVLFILIGYIAKESVDFIWISFIVYSLSIRYIRINSPLKIEENKNIRWHEKGIDVTIMVVTIISLICLYFNLFLMLNTILWSVIMVALLLFRNDRERV